MTRSAALTGSATPARLGLPPDPDGEHAGVDGPELEHIGDLPEGPALGADHGLDQVALRACQHVGDGAVPLERFAQRPLGVLAAPLVQPLELVQPEAEREVAALELLVQRVQDVGQDRVGGRGVVHAEPEADRRHPVRASRRRNIEASPEPGADGLQYLAPGGADLRLRGREHPLRRLGCVGRGGKGRYGDTAARASHVLGGPLHGGRLAEAPVAVDHQLAARRAERVFDPRNLTLAVGEVSPACQQADHKGICPHEQSPTKVGPRKLVLKDTATGVP
jgi:hypothetical protein